MKRITFIILCLLSFLNVYSQGRYKPGKYVERYDFPYTMLTYDDGRTYYNGVIKMWIDIEDNANAIFLQWHDSNGDYIDHEFFLDSPAPLVINRTGDERVKSTAGDYITMRNSYTIYWGNVRYIFFLLIDDNGTFNYKIDRLEAKNGKQVRTNRSFTCTIDKSNILAIGRIFNEAKRRGAVRLRVE